MEKIRSATVCPGSEESNVRVCLLGGNTMRLLNDLNIHGATSTKCVVWCGHTGLDLIHDDGAHHLFTAEGMPQAWPPITVVCMRYGAEQAAKRMYEAGAPLVIWVSINLLHGEMAALPQLVNSFVLGEGGVVTSGCPVDEAMPHLRETLKSMSGRCGRIPMGISGNCAVPAARQDGATYPVIIRVEPPSETNLLNVPRQVTKYLLTGR